MRDRTILFTPFSFTDLQQVEIHKVPSEHARAKIVGTVETSLGERYEQMNLTGVPATIGVQDDGGGETFIFKGILEELSVYNEGGTLTVSAELISSSVLMDQNRKSRTFQDASMTYDEMLHFIDKDYAEFNFVMTKGNGESLKDLVIQYRETDWEFAKRMASHFETVITPAYEQEGTKYWFGIPNRGGSVSPTPISYRKRKTVGDYIYKEANEVSGIGEKDAVYYEIKDREVYEIGQKISFQGENLYVYEIHSYLEGGELIHWYTLREENGFKVPKQYNERQIGTSLEGSILEIQQDQVKVHVWVDESQDKATAKWFPYSSVYSSPDGTGWYAMPEENDAIRLYIPDEKETNGYIISAVHLESSASDERVNPDNKSLMTKYHKEVLFTPNSLTFTNNKGMSIEILDEEGITIISDKKITIIADESVAIASTTADLQVIAPENITMMQGNTQINLEENVVFAGAQLNVQP